MADVAALAAAIEATPLAAALRASRWTYPLINAAHVLGIALLFGAIVPLDLRLAGLWQRIPLPHLEAVLVPVAAAGLALALLTGPLLFAVQAKTYAAQPLFWVKLGIVALGVLNALLWRRTRIAGLASLGCWCAAIVCGRMLGYV